MNSTAFSKICTIFILVFSLVMVSACLSQADETFTGDLREFVHSNGLVIYLPDKLTAETTNNGFWIQPQSESDRKVRNPMLVSVERQSKFEVLPNAKQRTVNNRTINYQIEETGEGSGGTEYRLTAWEFNESDFTVYGQSYQTEYGTPDFSVCWKVIRHTQVKK